MVHFINHTEPRPGDQHEDDDDTEPARVLRVQLRTRGGQPLGLLVLRYIADQTQDDAHFRAFVEMLSGTLSVAIETRSLIEGQKKLLDAVIRLLADAIDAKSPLHRRPLRAGARAGRSAHGPHVCSQRRPVCPGHHDRCRALRVPPGGLVA